MEEEEGDDEACDALTIDDQLQLLLNTLQKNVKVNADPTNNQGNSKKQQATDANETANTQRSQGTAGAGDMGWVEWHQNSQLITKAYKMINEVIMHPTIMWNRQFFYSLGAMAAQEQEIMHDWFQEMNEKQKIYIKEIERANDQLKETAAQMFLDKGYSQEQADLFLKKVNFMENREYFFHKRKYMAR